MAAWRSALAEEVVLQFRAAITDIPATRARRAPVGEEERPLLSVTTGEARAEEGMAGGETLWTVEIIVTGYAAAPSIAGASVDALDLAAEDAAAELERRIVAALNNRTLGITLGIFVAGSSVEVIPAEQSAARLADVTVIFQARLLLPANNPSI